MMPQFQDRDLLDEVGRIERQTAGARDPLCPLATSAHLHAVIQLVREARDLIHPGVPADMQTPRQRAWLTEAEKVLRDDTAGPQGDGELHPREQARQAARLRSE